jgi:hypothetical protein
MVPTPAAARYIATGEPRPPTPRELREFAGLLIVRLKPDATDVRRRRHAARDRRDDADRIAGLQRRLLFLQIPDVLVVHVDVDEAAQLPFLVVEVRLQPGVLRRQIGKQLADSLAVGLHRLFLVGERPERRGNQNLSCH